MLIGLTGGIGSGKSTIAHRLKEWGYAIYDTDQEAKYLLENDPHIQIAVKKLLGEQCYDATGHYQTRFVASKVFNNHPLLQQLNAIIHPAVQKDILKHNQPNSTLIIESAILFESGLNRICDKVISVIAPEQIRIERVISRDATDMNKVQARMRAQMQDQQRIDLSDIVINNDGTKTIDELCLYITQHL